jgi:hypothetical protein
MTCALFILSLVLLAVIAGAGAAGWFGGRRVVRHLQQNPAAAKQLTENVAEHVIIPLLGTAEEVKPDPEPEKEPEPKRVKVKATLI